VPALLGFYDLRLWTAVSADGLGREVVETTA